MCIYTYIYDYMHIYENTCMYHIEHMMSTSIAIVTFITISC